MIVLRVYWYHHFVPSDPQAWRDTAVDLRVFALTLPVTQCSSAILHILISYPKCSANIKKIRDIPDIRH